MGEIDINDLAKVGVVTDQPPYELPPEVLTLANNMRADSNGMKRLDGRTPTLGTNPRVSNDGPQFLMHISSLTQPWWLWTSLTKGYVFDGVNDTDITRTVGGNYNASDAKDWNGTIFGGVPILNSGNDKPQYWASYSAAQKLQDVTNWPANTTSRVVRSFLSYLFALNNTVSGVNFPHEVRWSTSAAPGALPSTWDYTDPTQDAGRTDLPDVASGMILDGQELNGSFYIYKESSVWRCQFIGGRFIFSFHSFLESTGLLSTRCIGMTSDGLQHVFASQDDIIVHNGSTAQSLLSKRMRRYLFNQIDPGHYNTSFMLSNPLQDEMWFCYPQSGALEPNRALIWNYKHDAITEADIDFRAYDIGTVLQTGLTWAQATGTWAADTGPWATSQRRRVVLCNPTTKKLLLMDAGSLNDGAAYTGTIQRTGLSVMGQKRSGEWIVDFKHRKMIQLLWPKIKAATPVNVRVGYQETPDGSVAWNPSQVFDPNSQIFVEGTEGSGRSVAIEFSSAADWRIDGYKLDIVPLGVF